MRVGYLIVSILALLSFGAYADKFKPEGGTLKQTTSDQGDCSDCTVAVTCNEDESISLEASKGWSGEATYNEEKDCYEGTLTHGEKVRNSN